MADVTASIAFVAEDQTSGAVSSATSSLNRMKAAIDGDIAELRGLQEAMKNLKGPGAENSETFRALQEQITAAKAKIQAGTQEYLNLGGSFTKVGAAEKLMTETTKKALGPYGELVERAGAIRETLSGAWAALSGAQIAAAGSAIAIAAMAVVVVAAAAAFANLVLEMAQFALTSSDAAIKSQVMLEGVTGSAAAAGELGSAVASVASKVPLAASEVQSLATELYKAGKRGAELEKALMMKALDKSGMAKASAEAMARRMANLDVQALKFKEHVAAMFSGPSTVEAVGRFEMGLKTIADMLDTDTASGAALQKVVSTMLDPLFDAATKVFPYLKAAFQGLVVGALLIAINVAKAGKWLKEAFGGDVLGDVNGLKLAFYGGIAVAGILAVAFVVLAAAAVVVAGAIVLVAIVAAGLLFVAFVALAAVPLLVVAAILLVVAVLAAVGYAIYEAVGALMDLGAAGIDAAGDLIDGLVGGITSGAGAVYDALRNMASQMGATIKSALGIASPSKLFAGFGEYTAQGMALGVEAGTEDVTAAVDNMVAPPEAGLGRSGGGKAHVTVPITITGASKAESAFAKTIVTQMCEGFETVLAELGVDAEVVPT